MFIATVVYLSRGDFWLIHGQQQSVGHIGGCATVVQRQAVVRQNDERPLVPYTPDDRPFTGCDLIGSIDQGYRKWVASG